MSSCAACLTVLDLLEPYQMIPCGHMFHFYCLSKVLEEGKTTCPQCKKEISSQKLIDDPHFRFHANSPKKDQRTEQRPTLQKNNDAVKNIAHKLAKLKEEEAKLRKIQKLLELKMKQERTVPPTGIKRPAEELEDENSALGVSFKKKSSDAEIEVSDDDVVCLTDIAPLQACANGLKK